MLWWCSKVGFKATGLILGLKFIFSILFVKNFHLLFKNKKSQSNGVKKCEINPYLAARFHSNVCVELDPLDRTNTCSAAQNNVRTRRRPLALIRGKVALVSVLIGPGLRGVVPPFLLNRKSTLEEVMA